jgi:arginyl-tRNA synthetase
MPKDTYSSRASQKIAGFALVLQPIMNTFPANQWKMEIIPQIRMAIRQALQVHFQLDPPTDEILVNQTKPEFEGDYTVVLFSFIKALKQSSETIGNRLGQALLESHPGLFAGFNVIKGFLNLTIADAQWLEFIAREHDNQDFGRKERTGSKVMIEYSSPNTNKPLHLGHLRNNFLGWSIAEIYKANGFDIVKTCIANDRGIHICKSMIAWLLFANGATPESTGIKGDHLVGDYYVRFGQEHKLEMAELVAGGMTAEQAEKEAPIMKAAQQMLVDWEAGQPEVIALWELMNSWVYAGFDETYRRIGSDFDKIYYESNTYLLGKELVELGLKKGVFEQEADGSVWIDLTADGLDRKIVRRRDGTAVYMTQDIGLAVKKYEEYHSDLSIYVVGDEQNYHFKVLKLICQKLGIPAADGIYHLSYGMVELPTGRMKTREGTVVDADDLLDEMVKEAERKTKEQGKTEGFTYDELEDLYDIIGLGGLKFFLLRVDPKKRMVFNPEESIDLHGYTATFVQYAYARIRSILRKEAGAPGVHPQGRGGTASPTAGVAAGVVPLLPLERALAITLERFPAVLGQACIEMSPSVVAAYAFELAKTFNSFYAEHSIASAETPEKKALRLGLSRLTATVIQNSLNILGIRVPERM